MSGTLLCCLPDQLVVHNLKFAFRNVLGVDLLEGGNNDRNDYGYAEADDQKNDERHGLAAGEGGRRGEGHAEGKNGSADSADCHYELHHYSAGNAVSAFQILFRKYQLEVSHVHHYVAHKVDKGGECGCDQEGDVSAISSEGQNCIPHYKYKELDEEQAREYERMLQRDLR